VTLTPSDFTTDLRHCKHVTSNNNNNNNNNIIIIIIKRFKFDMIRFTD